jgi:hypothetical protein
MRADGTTPPKRGGGAMTETWALAALWLGLALAATLTVDWLRAGHRPVRDRRRHDRATLHRRTGRHAALGSGESWINFCLGTGAIVLTFLAGAELDPKVFKLKWKEAGAVGLASFFLPFLGCTAAAYWLLGWEPMASWLAGIAMSTTSVAVVYAVMLEFGL